MSALRALSRGPTSFARLCSCTARPSKRILSNPRSLWTPPSPILNRLLSTTSPRWSNNSPDSSSSSSSESVEHSKLSFKADAKLQITFTCTVTDCNTRSSHEFTKRSYTKGIVIVQCPGCKNRHLIADHLGWFKESTEDGKLKTVEDLVKAKGEKVRRGRVDGSGDIEYVPE